MSRMKKAMQARKTKNTDKRPTNSVKEGVFGKVKSREEVMKEIKNTPKLYEQFLELNEDFQERFVEFCMGVRGVMMTYDPFFKKIFDVETHPERLSDFISSVIGKKIVVKRALPKEHSRISEKGALLIMDILAETEERELVNVEIQKIGYYFPGERAACYMADLIMRQYEREKSLRGKAFTYRDMRKVYTIIIMESSSKEFWAFPDKYIHPGEWGFRTGVKLNLLAEFYFIPLDIFFRIEDNKKEETKMSELEAWLYFIGSDKPKDVERVLAADPKFEEMYREVVNFRLHPEEAIGMFSKALKELDENTVTYMIEDLKQELEELRRAREKELKEKAKEMEEKNREMEEKNREMEEKAKELKEKAKEMEEKNREMEEKNKKLEESAKEIERLRKLLAEKEK